MGPVVQNIKTLVPTLVERGHHKPKVAFFLRFIVPLRPDNALSRGKGRAALKFVKLYGLFQELRRSYAPHPPELRLLMSLPLKPSEANTLIQKLGV